jgi:hypothetical protein
MTKKQKISADFAMFRLAILCPSPGANHEPPATSHQPPTKLGRPPLLDGPNRAAVLALLTLGCSQRRAARQVGVAESAIRQLARRDPAFRAAVEKARSTTKFRHLPVLREAGSRSWRVIARCLEARYPKKYNLNPHRKPKRSR